MQRLDLKILAVWRLQASRARRVLISIMTTRAPRQMTNA
jgi:hypothetical protein